MYGTPARIEPVFSRNQKALYIGASGVTLGYILSALRLPYWVFILFCIISLLIFNLRHHLTQKHFAYSKVEDVEAKGVKIKDNTCLRMLTRHPPENGSDWEVDNLVKEEDVKGWVNEVLVQQWMWISQAATKTMVGFLDPLFESNRPKWLKFLKVQRLDLGHCPPIIKRVWVQTNECSSASNGTTEEPRSTVLMIDVQWTVGNAELDIITSANSDLFAGIVGSVAVRITDFKFMGTLRIELCDFNGQWPTFSTLRWGFAIKPRFRFETTVVSQYFAAGISPLRDFIKGLLADSLVKSLVFPKYYEIKLGASENRQAEALLEKYTCSICGERTALNGSAGKDDDSL